MGCNTASCTHRRIDGKDGVAGWIPAGGSTPDQRLRPGFSTRPLACSEGSEPPFARDLPETQSVVVETLSMKGGSAPLQRVLGGMDQDRYDLVRDREPGALG